jgi:chromosome segregation ATPase
MIEPIMYFGIGFLLAALLGLLFVPVVHHRAVRLTKRRLEAAAPLSIAETRADKDQLRAQFAMSIRRLETTVEQMKTKTATQLVEMSKKKDTINQLKKEFGEKIATIAALEARNKTLGDQLRAAEERFEVDSSSLRKAEYALSDNEAELAKLISSLADNGRLLDEREYEIQQLHHELDAARDIEDDLRSELVAARSRGRSVANRLHSEIDRLQAELLHRD